MRSRMNIWLLTSQYPPITSGIARYVENIASMFSLSGHYVTVLTPDTLNEESTPLPRLRIVRWNASKQAPQLQSLSHWPALSLSLATQLYQLAERDGQLPDIIESQEYGALAYFLLQQRLIASHSLSKVPLVLSLHSPHYAITHANGEAQYQLPSYWVGRMERFCMLAADALLTSSLFMRKHIEAELAWIDTPIDTIPLPYRALTIQEHVPTPGDLLCYGRLQVLKGVIPLVEVCERLWQAGHRFRLTLMGNDTRFVRESSTVASYLRQHYQQRITQGYLRIEADSPLSDQALFKRLGQAWAVIIPSLWENYPNTCIESMLLGKLVIASSSGGQAEMIGADGQAGLLFDWAIPGDCERAIRQALAMDAAQVQAIGRQAQARIRELTSFERVLPKREAHFERVIAAFQPRTQFPSLTAEAQGRILAPGSDETQGLLSVVVPFYKLGEYVAETLSSIVQSSYRPLEVLVIDDGSDAAHRVAFNELCGRYPELVRSIRSENGGLAQARNRGAEAARGEFLAFVDADDLVEPDFFTRSVAVLQRYTNVSMVYSWVQYFGDSADCWPTFNTEFPYLLAHNMLTAFVVLRRSHFLAFGRNNPDIAYAMEDYESWIRMLAQGCIGVSIPEPLVRYRTRPESMLRAMNEEQVLYLSEMIAEQHPQLYQRYGPELFALQNANGPALRWTHPAAEQIDFRIRYHELLGAHQRLLGMLGPIRPAVKALRGLQSRLGRKQI